jgi:hypothetical protein
VMAATVHDGRGAPLGPWRARFRTGASVDRRPPTWLALTCSLDELELEDGCALVDDGAIELRMLVDEAVSVRWRGADREGVRACPGGLLELALRGLEPERDVELALELRDASDNAATRSLALRTTEPLATVSIVEVRADPLGPEPRQEMVELLNYGDRAVELQGFALSDDAESEGDVIERRFELAPGARVLLVADDFDADDPHDVRPPPGASLLRMGTSLGRSGLANGGEPLFLRDARGRRISAAPALPAARPGACIQRVSADMRDGAETAFGALADDTCSPGS